MNDSLLSDDTLGTCQICLDRIADKSVLASTSCFHKFHEGCIRDWFTHSAAKSCPICRTEIFKVYLQNGVLDLTDPRLNLNQAQPSQQRHQSQRPQRIPEHRQMVQQVNPAFDFYHQYVNLYNVMHEEGPLAQRRHQVAERRQSEESVVFQNEQCCEKCCERCCEQCCCGRCSGQCWGGCLGITLGYGGYLTGLSFAFINTLKTEAIAYPIVSAIFALLLSVNLIWSWHRSLKRLRDYNSGILFLLYSAVFFLVQSFIANVIFQIIGYVVMALIFCASLIHLFLTDWQSSFL